MQLYIYICIYQNAVLVEHGNAASSLPKPYLKKKKCWKVTLLINLTNFYITRYVQVQCRSNAWLHKIIHVHFYLSARIVETKFSTVVHVCGMHFPTEHSYMYAFEAFLNNNLCILYITHKKNSSNFLTFGWELLTLGFQIYYAHSKLFNYTSYFTLLYDEVLL